MKKKILIAVFVVFLVGFYLHFRRINVVNGDSVYEAYSVMPSKQEFCGSGDSVQTINYHSDYLPFSDALVLTSNYGNHYEGNSERILCDGLLEVQVMKQDKPSNHSIFELVYHCDAIRQWDVELDGEKSINVELVDQDDTVYLRGSFEKFGYHFFFATLPLESINEEEISNELKEFYQLIKVHE